MAVLDSVVGEWLLRRRSTKTTLDSVVRERLLRRLRWLCRVATGVAWGLSWRVPTATLLRRASAAVRVRSEKIGVLELAWRLAEVEVQWTGTVLGCSCGSRGHCHEGCCKFH